MISSLILHDIWYKIDFTDLRRNIDRLFLTNQHHHVYEVLDEH
jgi:hypothetical protein